MSASNVSKDSPCSGSQHGERTLLDIDNMHNWDNLLTCLLQWEQWLKQDSIRPSRRSEEVSCCQSVVDAPHKDSCTKGELNGVEHSQVPPSHPHLGGHDDVWYPIKC